jgi:hypothetical protein
VKGQVGEMPMNEGAVESRARCRSDCSSSEWRLDGKAGTLALMPETTNAGVISSQRMKLTTALQHAQHSKLSIHCQLRGRTGKQEVHVHIAGANG